MVEDTGTIPAVVVVEGTVNGIGTFRNRMRISIGIPSFKSDYDTHCSDFPDGMDSQLKMSQLYRFELKRQSKVAKQGGGEWDGTKPYHYYWGINRLAEGGALTQFASPQGPTAAPSQGNGLRNDPTGVSIERQVAFKGAIDLAVARIQAGETVTMETVLEQTAMAAITIHGGPVEPQTPDAPEEAPAAAPAPPRDQTEEEAFDALGGSRGPAVDEIGNLGDFMTKAMQQGHGVSSVVLKKLGVSKPVEIVPKWGTFDAAFAALGTP